MGGDDPTSEATTIEELDELEIVLDEPRATSAPTAAPEVPPLARLGRYELLGRMAIGGMAEIFLARERARAGGTRQLVVKILRPELSGDDELEAMFLNEGRIALQLSHPNVCHVYEFGLERGRCFIAMEHVHGVTLRELARRAALRGERVPIPVLVKIAAEVAEALHAAHHATDASGRPLGVVHRDVSPHNVMIGFDGVVKLLDFGVAHARTETPGAERAGTIKGKIGYLAPEQCLGRPVDARTDVFALGVCLWELLSAERLFRRETDYDTLHAIVTEDAPAPRGEVPERLARIVRRTLERVPELRFQSAAELADALEQYLTDERERVGTARLQRYVRHLFGEEASLEPELDRSASAVAWIHAAPGRLHRRIASAALAAVALIALASIGAFVWTAHEEEPASASAIATVSHPEPSPPAWPSPAVSTAPPVADPAPVVETVAPDAPVACDPTVGAREPTRRRHRRPPPGGFVEDPGF